MTLLTVLVLRVMILALCFWFMPLWPALFASMLLVVSNLIASSEWNKSMRRAMGLPV